MKHLDGYGGRAAETVREPRVLELREKRVMLDVDLAPLLGLPLRELRRQASRNGDRFLPGWLLRLAAAEKRALGVAPRDRAIAVTEHGLVALAMILRTSLAADWSVQVIRGLVEGSWA